MPKGIGRANYVQMRSGVRVYTRERWSRKVIEVGEAGRVRRMLAVWRYYRYKCEGYVEGYVELVKK